MFLLLVKWLFVVFSWPFEYYPNTLLLLLFLFVIYSSLVCCFLHVILTRPVSYPLVKTDSMDADPRSPVSMFRHKSTKSADSTPSDWFEMNLHPISSISDPFSPKDMDVIPMPVQSMSPFPEPSPSISQLSATKISSFINSSERQDKNIFSEYFDSTDVESENEDIGRY